MTTVKELKTELLRLKELRKKYSPLETIHRRACNMAMRDIVYKLQQRGIQEQDV